MNPSKSNWIAKYFKETALYHHEIIDEAAFYDTLRQSGFTYGYTSKIPISYIKHKQWSTEEKAKITLLHCLFKTYTQQTHNFDVAAFLATTVAFYQTLEQFKASYFFDYILPVIQDEEASLEKIINSRVQTTSNIIERNFSHNLSNALLFIDVLAYRRFLNDPHGVLLYFKELEKTIIQLIYYAYQQKSSKTKYDDLILDLFDQSVRYTKIDFKEQALSHIPFDTFTSLWGKNYLLDLTNCVMWSDKLLESSEIKFIYKVGRHLSLQDDAIKKSLIAIEIFIVENKEDIPYFQFSHPIKKFYKHTSKAVLLMLERNKQSLAKELSNNKELLFLLAKATHKNLAPQEKKRIKKQLIELSKTIPSLTLFILPGGSLLLPLLIKFAPQILPATFNENLDEQ